MGMKTNPKRSTTKKWLTYFVNGIILLLPIVLVVYVIYQSFIFLDNLLGRYIRMEFHQYIPGLGLLLTIVLITFVGMIASTFVSKWVFDVIERILNQIPFIKTLYSIVKETIQSLLGEKKAFSKVVLITLPGSEMRVLGFVTSEDVSSVLPHAADHIAVYLPQSFQMAGLTVIVPRTSVEFVDTSVENAMSFILSAGVSSPSGM